MNCTAAPFRVIGAHHENRTELPLVIYRRSMRAAKALGVMLAAWLIGVLMIAVPVVHFFVPPVMLVAGPIAAWLVYRNSGSVGPADLQCPDCNAAVHLECEPMSKAPIYVPCGSCGQSVALVAEDT